MIQKNNNATFNTIGIIATVGSIPASYYSIFKDFDSTTARFLFALITGGCVLVIIFIARKMIGNLTNPSTGLIQDLQPEPSIINDEDPNSQEPGYILGSWELIKQETKITFNDSGTLTKIEQNFEIQRIRPAKYFYFRLIGASNIKDLTIEDYTLERRIEGQELWVFIKIDNQDLSSSFRLKVSYDLIDLFKSNHEWWFFKKAYPKGIVKTVFHIPNSRPFKGFYPKAIRDNKGFGGERYDLIKYHYNQERQESILIMQSDDLKVNDELRLEWDW
jgi:hypothetical protein